MGVSNPADPGICKLLLYYNETRRYFVTTSPIGWVQTLDLALVLNVQDEWVIVFYEEGLSQMPHDDVIKRKHLPRYWPFVRGIHWSLVNSPHKGKWRGALMISLICAWING